MVEPDYRRFFPRETLAHVVSEIWCQSAEPSPSASTIITRVLPTGAPELTFNFGDRFLEVTDQSELALPWASINGQKTIAKRYRAAESTGLVIVRLQPWGLAAFRCAPAALFRDLNVDADEVWPSSELNRLQDALGEAQSAPDRASVVQDFLERMLFPEADRMDSEMVRACDALFSDGYSPRVSDLSIHLGLTARTIEKRFKESIGISPQQFLSILRLQRTLALLCDDRSAYLHWYYDQSHFIRELKKRAGLHPGAMEGLATRSPLGRFFNGRSHLSNTIYVQEVILRI